MQIYIKTLLTAALASCLTVSLSAQEDVLSEETCSTGMTKFQDTPQSFNSILIHPTCSKGSMFTTTQLAWTIEPTTGDEVSIYSIPPEAVTATLEDNVLVFDLNEMGKVPEKAGVVIQVPQNQITEITVDGIMNYV
jgi:hypothetical protein